MSPLTSEELAALEALEKAATQPPWNVLPSKDSPTQCDGINAGDGYDPIVKTDCGIYPPERPDADLIAALRNAAPRLLAEVRALRQVVTSMLAANEEERNELRDVLGKPRQD